MSISVHVRTTEEQLANSKQWAATHFICAMHGTDRATPNQWVLPQKVLDPVDRMLTLYHARMRVYSYMTTSRQVVYVQPGAPDRVGRSAEQSFQDCLGMAPEEFEGIMRNAACDAYRHIDLNPAPLTGAALGRLAFHFADAVLPCHDEGFDYYSHIDALCVDSKKPPRPVVETIAQARAFLASDAIPATDPLRRIAGMLSLPRRNPLAGLLGLNS